MQREISNSNVIDEGKVLINQPMQITQKQLNNISEPKIRVRSHLLQPIEEEPYANLKEKNRTRKIKKLTHKQCPVCYTQYKKEDLIVFACCNHRYCPPCLRLHIQNSINTFSTIKCLDQNCPQILQIQSPHISSLPILKIQKYYRILAFDKDPSIKLCPIDGCFGFVDVAFDPVACEICKTIFCKKCQMKFHQGDCDQNGVYFLQKTFLFRRCCKCRIVVQNSLGCNHMTCKCGHQFCYICGENWSGQSLNKCSLPTNPPAVRIEPAPITIPPSKPKVPIIACNINVPNSPIVSNAPIIPIASNASDIPILQLNDNSQQKLQRPAHPINIARQRQPALPSNDFCICLKHSLVLLLCILVSLLSSQFVIFVGLCIVLFLMEIFVFFYSILLGVAMMVQEYSCREMLLGSIFLLAYCIGCQFCRKTQQYFPWEDRPQWILFPLSSHLFVRLTQ